MRIRKSYFALAILAVGVPAFLLLKKAQGSDHADTFQTVGTPSTDISDVYIFPSPTDSTKVVLAMSFRPLITPAQVASTFLDPNVLYQMKIDNNGDEQEDLVIQAWAEGTGATQVIKVAGPVRPNTTGVVNEKLTAHTTTGSFGQAFTPTSDMRAYVGVRRDTFFLDLDRFLQILPDRGTALTGIPDPTPNTPRFTTWRTPGVDFLAAGNFNVISFVVEIPKDWLLQ